jgi:hypothetical protein
MPSPGSRRTRDILRPPCLELERIAVIAVAKVRPNVSGEEPDSPVALPLVDVHLLVSQHALVEMAFARENVRREGDGDITPRKEDPSEGRAIVNLHCDEYSVGRTIPGVPFVRSRR